jgi:hypothetical protein
MEEQARFGDSRILIYSESAEEKPVRGCLFPQKKAHKRGWAPLVGLLLMRTEVLIYPFNPPQ